MPDGDTPAFDISKAAPDEIIKAAGGFQRLIPEDFKVDYKGELVPATKVPFFAEPKSIKDFLGSAYEAHKAYGERVKIPAKESRPDEINAFKQRVRDSGIYVEKPYPETPDKYEIKPPEGFELDPKTIDGVRQILHKHGVPQEAATELMGAYFENTKDVMPLMKEIQRLVPILKQTKAEAMKEFEETIKKNAHEPEQVKAMIGRYSAKRFSAEDIALMGDLSNPPALGYLFWLGIGVLAAIAVVYVLAGDLNLLLSGEPEAEALGVNVERTKLLVYLAASFATGLAVSVSGAIGYVGLLVPHLVRLVFGGDYRLLVPATALGGAIVLVTADMLARTIVAPSELPVGAVMALVGAPVFIYLLRSRLAPQSGASAAEGARK